MNRSYYEKFFEKIVNFAGYPKKVVELGVFKGKFGKRFLTQFPEVDEYWGIDPYIPYEKEDGAFVYHHTVLRMPEDINDPFEWHYVQTSKKMREYPQYTLLRMKSHEASIFFPDEYLDFVYIDGDHKYEEVKRDIECWFPKVKKGGCIGGHDYGKKNYLGVRRAVKESFGDFVITIPSVTVWLYHVK